MAPVGTLEWAEHTDGGILRIRDYATLSLSLGAMWLGLVGARLAGEVAGHRPVYLRPRKLIPPSFEAGERAAKLAQDTYEPWLLNHCRRTFIYAAALAMHGSTPIDYDPEILYVAAMLHDIGLTSAYANAPVQAPCFAVRGAEVAREIARDSSWDTARQHQVAEAVAMHINAAVPRRRKYPEAYLVAAGTVLDLTEFRYKRVDDRVIAYATTNHDRLGITTHMLDANGPWKTETRARPGCRIGLLSVGGILHRLIERVP